MNILKLKYMQCMILAGAIAVLSACSEDGFELEKYKTHYTMIPDSLEVLSGHNRIKIQSLVSDPSIALIKVYWNNMSDSLVIPVTGIGKVSASIEDLAEGTYNLTLYTFDKNNVSSRKLEYTAQVYGDTYINSLHNRAVKNGVIVNGETRIEWASGMDPADIGVNIKYMDENGQDQKKWVPRGDGITRIDDQPQGDSLQYRTVFLPQDGIDTLYMEYQTVHLVPAVPVILDKGKFGELKLPTDAPISKYAKKDMAGLWDGVADNVGFYGTNAGHTNPHWFTFTMGVTANLNRLVMYQRPGNAAYNLLYANANVKSFEVWGSNNPNPDGSWDSWTKLMSCESVKPSGLPLGKLSQADIDYAIKGEVFPFPKKTPIVKYIRIKVLDTWDPKQNDHSLFGELTFYGIVE